MKLGRNSVSADNFEPYKRAVSATLATTFFAAVAIVAQVSKESVTGAIHPHGGTERTAFYDTPTPLPQNPPGTLIRAEEFDGYTLPPGVVAIRFLYHSRSASGEDVPVSGVVLVSDGNPPAGGWPVIAWAHRFEGVGRECAPSLQENLSVGSYFAMYVKLGYAVVVTDYAGLGVSGRAGYLNLRADSLDVIYGVSAARSAARQLGARWIVAGEGEGGLVAESVAESERRTDVGGFLGGVVVGGLFDPAQIITRPGQMDGGKAVDLAYGIKADAPQFVVSDILTEHGLKLYADAAKSCGEPEGFLALAGAQLLKAGWETNPYVRRYLATNKIGQQATGGPLLVLASDSDGKMPVARTVSVVKELCERGDRVLFYRYPTPNAETLMGDSVTDQIAWSRERFQEQVAPSNCH